jgi:1,2-phenylacetyl-CoA epoxidase PaaB subunit
MTYEITTQAATRSKSRQQMTHTIQADNEDDAIYEARKAHVARVGWNASVWVATVRAL